MDPGITQEEELFGNESNYLKAEFIILYQAKLFWNSPEQTSAVPALICSWPVSSRLGLATNQESFNACLQTAKLSWGFSAHLKCDCLLRHKI